MKWLLVVMIFGTTPVPTNLVFDSLTECLRAEDQMRASYITAFNSWATWAQRNPQASGFPGSQAFMQRRNGLENFGQCIPHPADAPN